VDETATQIERALPSVLENMPNSISLGNPVDLRNGWRSIDWFLGATVRGSFDLAIFVVIVMTVIVGIVVAAVGSDNIRGWLRWLGSSLLIPASLFVLMGISLSTPLIAGPLRNELRFTQWDGIQYSDAFRQAMGDLIISITQRVGSGFLTTGIAACFIAIALIVLSLFFTSSQRHEAKMVQIPVQNQ
jgi:hypothetical protein